MRNYFGVTQRHIGTRAIYNYIASRQNRNGIKNRNSIIKIRRYTGRNHSMIKNTKLLNKHTWGKVPIGMHLIK